MAATFSVHIKLCPDSSSPWCKANWTIHLKYAMFHDFIFRGILHFEMSDSNSSSMVA